MPARSRGTDRAPAQQSNDARAAIYVLVLFFMFAYRRPMPDILPASAPPTLMRLRRRWPSPSAMMVGSGCITPTI